MTNDNIDYIALYSASVHFGCYPVAVIDRNGVRAERTPYQEGWNASHAEFTSDIRKIKNFILELSDSDQQAIIYLFAAGLSFNNNDDLIRMELNMNDTFYGGSDDEEVLLADIPTLCTMWNNYKHDGITAWVSHKRNQLPLEKYITVKFDAALNELNDDKF